MARSLPNPTRASASKRQPVIARSMDFLIAVTAVALGLQLFLSGGTLKDLPVFLSLVGFISIRLLAATNRLQNETTWAFGVLIVVSVMWAISNPAWSIITLAAPIAGQAWLALGEDRRAMTAASAIVPVTMASIALIGQQENLSKGELRVPVYLALCVFLVGVVVAQLVRQYFVWLVEANEQTARDNQQLQVARDTLEQQVAERTQQLQEQNANLELARQEAVRLSRVKTDFLATMSHEIRTPMNGILGMSELLLSMPLHPKQREYANIVFDSGQALMSVINDILDYARLEAGSLRVVIERCDPIPICQDVVRLMSARAHEKSLMLDVVVDTPPGTCCMADAARLRQVLLNLVGNAVKFTDQGAVVMHTEIEADMIRFSVQDSGIGIAPEFQKLLFQPFSQADATNSRAHGGSGLGLAICKQLVERMNGAIGLHSIVGDGSTFWFTLPICPSEGKPVTAPPAESTPAA